VDDHDAADDDRGERDDARRRGRRQSDGTRVGNRIEAMRKVKRGDELR